MPCPTLGCCIRKGRLPKRKAEGQITRLLAQIPAEEKRKPLTLFFPSKAKCPPVSRVRRRRMGKRKNGFCSCLLQKPFPFPVCLITRIGKTGKKGSCPKSRLCRKGCCPRSRTARIQPVRFVSPCPSMTTATPAWLPTFKAWRCAGISLPSARNPCCIKIKSSENILQPN